MMEHRKALTISLTVDKDTSMGNPLKLPKSQSSPERGKLSGQMNGTGVVEYKVRYPDAQHRKGTTLFEHNQRIMIRLGMASKTPCLVLRDVLQTEPGRAFLHWQQQQQRRRRRRQSHSPLAENGVQAAPDTNGQTTTTPPPSSSSSSLLRRGCRSEEVQERKRRALASPQSPASSDLKTTAAAAAGGGASPPRLPDLLHTTPRRPQERPLQRREATAVGEPLTRADGRFTEGRAPVNARVTHCDRGSGPPVTPWTISRRGLPAGRARWTDPGWNGRQIQLKRPSHTSPARRNGVSAAAAAAARALRNSVFRHPGVGKADGRSPHKRPYVIRGRRSYPHGQSASPVRGPVRITLDRLAAAPAVAPAAAAAAARACLLPSGSPSSGGGGKSSASPVLNQDDGDPSDLIVLSSDESESGDHPAPRRRPVGQLKVCVGAAGSVKRAPKKTPVLQEEDTNTKVAQVVEDDFPGDKLSAFIVSSMSSLDYACMTLSFYTLHSGCYKGLSNGNIMIQCNRLLIPLKDSSSKLRVLFAVEFKELRSYSLWEHSELRARGLRFQSEHLQPPMFLLLLVSYPQAVAAQTLLLKMSGRRRGADTMDHVSPFLLLSLRTRVQGVESAVLRSALELATLTHLSGGLPSDRPLDFLGGLDDVQTPEMSLDDSLAFIKRVGLDPQLLSMLGAGGDGPGAAPPPEAPPSPPEPAGLFDLHIQVCDPDTGLLSELSTVIDDEAPPPPPPPPPESPPRGGEEAEPPPPAAAAAPQQPPERQYTLCHRRAGAAYAVSRSAPDASWAKFKHQGLARRLIQFPPPPLKGGITVTMEDLQCLDSGQYLNDVIIDFYLKFLLDQAPTAVSERSHVFSSFFYKQLTRRDNASEDAAGAAVSQSLRRHQRVKTWTRHVDIFQKDFLFVPVNQEAHWYLVVICFPGLEEPSFARRTEAGWEATPAGGSGPPPTPPVQEEAWDPPESNDPILVEPASPRADKSNGPTEKVGEEVADSSSPPGPPDCTEETCQRDTVCKRPCILIMDSLKLSLHERIFKLMREYLQAEWESRRGSSRVFGAEQMAGAHCRVPLQDNCSDCGLYLLQYVESFLKDPVLHFDLPLRLERWFPRQQVRRKRDEIRDLVLYLYRQQLGPPPEAT